jgi:hypothetical protein
MITCPESGWVADPRARGGRRRPLAHRRVERRGILRALGEKLKHACIERGLETGRAGLERVHDVIERAQRANRIEHRGP